jgi:Domain of unknown function (DUF4260)
MKTTLKIEELGMFLLSVFLFGLLMYPWWIFLLLILAPDVSIIAYQFGPKAGALVYNTFHHKGLAIGLYIIGSYFFSYPIILIGIMIFAHSSLDRVFGFGLKYEDSFNHTHLGMIGKSK